MLSITLKSGIIHEYPSGILTLERVLQMLELDIWYLDTDGAVEIYRTSEIAHITIIK
ncbi:hypothetical protein [Bacillus sp. FF-1]|uniref:hypothetical protein n=1 Tax=Bacillus sp. FF-1 TaxID=3025192 RepID=UPI00234EFD1A|nr:hypothetical protein [Bacillus sp. FF-1]MDC7739536.1 hypothetical protein [Bacillus sp. FF-1]